MANLATSAVTILRDWTEGGVNGKRIIGVKAQVVLTGQGGATNKITAASFGLSRIERCSNLNGEDTNIYPAAVSADETFVLVADTSQDSGAGSDPADVTHAAAYITVWGFR